MYTREISISPDAEVKLAGIFRVQAILGKSEWQPVAIYEIHQNGRPTGQSRFLYSGFDSIDLEISKRHVYESDGTIPRRDSYMATDILFIEKIKRTELLAVKDKLLAASALSQEAMCTALNPYIFNSAPRSQHTFGSQTQATAL